MRWLLDHAGVDETLVPRSRDPHGRGETRDLARSGAVAGLCPVTEANLGDGMFNAADYLRAGGRYGVGTDSNVASASRAELRQLEYAQSLRARARNVCAPPGGSTRAGDARGGLGRRRAGAWAQLAAGSRPARPRTS